MPIMKKIVFRMLLFTLILSFFSCSSLLYYPTHDYYYSPRIVGLKPQENYITTRQNQKMYSWWFYPENRVQSKGLIIYFHGNGQNLSAHFLQLSWLVKEGYELFIFDYPEYGLSEGSANTKNVVEASVDVLNWVLEKSTATAIYIYGQSMGGITSLKALELTPIEKQKNIRALILDGTFYSYQKIAQDKLSQHWWSWFLQPLAYVILSDKYAPEHLNQIKIQNKLVIVGMKDNIVEPYWGITLYQKLSEPKMIWKQEQANHIETFMTEDQKYKALFLDFLSNASH